MNGRAEGVLYQLELLAGEAADALAGTMDKTTYDADDDGVVDDADALGGAAPASYMLKADYDADNDGTVDDAEQLGGVAAASYMLKATYDTDNDGTVDNAEQLGGVAPAGYVKVDGSNAFTADQSMGTKKLTNLGDPTAAQDAATKDYVDTGDAAVADFFSNVSDSLVPNTQTDIFSHTFPANTFAANGDRCEFWFAGSFAAGVALKYMQVYLGTDLIWDPGDIAQDGGVWEVRGFLVRASSTVIRCFVTSEVVGSAASAHYNEVTGLTLSNTLTFELQASSDNGAEVTGRMGFVKFRPHVP